MSNMDIAKTPKQTWNNLLTQLILEPESKLELEHDFDSIFKAWAKLSTGGFGMIKEVAVAPAFTLLIQVIQIALESQRKSFKWQNRLIEAQKQVPVMKEGANPNQRADGFTQDHHTLLSGNNSLPSQGPT